MLSTSDFFQLGCEISNVYACELWQHYSCADADVANCIFVISFERVSLSNNQRPNAFQSVNTKVERPEILNESRFNRWYLKQTFQYFICNSCSYFAYWSVFFTNSYKHLYWSIGNEFSDDGVQRWGKYTRIVILLLKEYFFVSF